MHVCEQLREGLRRDEVARREPRAVLERERGRVDLHGVGQEPALDAQPRRPRAFTLQLPAQNLEQHLGEPVLARVENREDDVGERPAPEVDERRGAAAHRPIGERIGRAHRSSLDGHTAARERRRERPRGVQIRVGEGHALHPGLPAERHGPLRSDAPAAPRPEEIVADRGGRLGGDRAGAVLERDHAEVRGPGDYRWRVDAGTGVDAEVHAVVVEAESRHGSRIPPGEVPGVPRVMNHGGLEIRAVAHELSGDPSNPLGPHRVGDRVDGGEGRIAHARSQRIHGVAARGPRGIAASVQDQVSLQHPRVHPPVHVQAGRHAIVRRKQHGRRRRDDQLGVAGGHREAIRVALIQHAAAVVYDVDPPGGAVEGGCVDQLREPLLERSLERRGARTRGRCLGRDRGANRKRCEDQLSHKPGPSRG